MASIVLENLAKRFPGPGGADICAVQNLNLQIRDGELLTIVGPSGCGKTTTLRLIAGLETPNEGKILFDGSVVTQLDARDRNVAMVFQSHALYPHMTARENLESGLRWRKVKPEELARRVNEITELLGLKECLGRLPEDLSGGECQRVALGRSLVLQPKILLLDEPLSNLDAPLRLQLRREIARLNRRLGITMLYVTHDQSEAMAFGGRIAVMEDGALQQVGTAHEIYEQPANTFVAGFFGTPPMNLLKGTLQQTDSGLRFATNDQATQFAIPNGVKSPANFTGKNIICGVRPEDLTVQEKAGSASLNGEIQFAEPCGQETILLVKLGEHEVSVRAAGNSFIPGQSVALALRAERLRFFDPVSCQAI